MQRQSWKLFPTLVQRCQGVLAPDELALIRSHCLTQESRPHGSLQGDAASTFAAQARFIEALQAQIPALAGLGERLSLLVNDYARELGHPLLRISNSWFNVQRPGSLLRHHTHPASYVSAALCIASDERSSKLFFENPNPLIGFVGHEQPTEFNMEMARFKLDPGDLLLFPSWLKHGSGYEANESALRIMVSLNTEVA
ncbi:putative 2OG-Fe(II) oxygenase [Roseateles paludis]|jgi:uncharacterized protein (TIGR02466 family)|uniref:2OG-Fe(II) oxygenase n=1 Tax=Roseateles paludis TaxID=3145238 RepID=A0ABV0FZ00_9BURK